MMKATIGEAIGHDGGSDEIDMLQRRVDALNQKMLNMVTESLKSGGDIETNEEEYKSIAEEIEQLKSRIQAIQEKVSVDENYDTRIARIKSLIEERNANPNRFDDTIVRRMVECIKVYHDGRIEIIFGVGYTIEESLETA